MRDISHLCTPFKFRGGVGLWQAGGVNFFERSGIMECSGKCLRGISYLFIDSLCGWDC